MLKTIRAVIKSPRLSPRPLFINASNNLTFRVAVRRTYVDLQTSNELSEGRAGVPETVEMPLVIDNSNKTLKLWLTPAKNTVYRHKNNILIAQFCQQIGVLEEQCSRLFGSVNIFIRQALLCTRTTARGASQTLPVTTCLHVHKASSLDPSEMSTGKTHSLACSNETDGFGESRFTFNLPPGAYEIVAQVHGRYTNVEKLITNFNASMRRVVALPGWESSGDRVQWTDDRKAMLDSCEAAVDVNYPSILSSVPVSVEIQGNGSGPAYGKLQLNVQCISSSKRPVQAGSVCAQIFGENRVACQRCSRGNSFMLPIFKTKSLAGLGSYVRFSAWWAGDTMQEEEIFRCSHLRTRWAYHVYEANGIRFPGKHDNGSGSTNKPKPLVVVTAASSSYFTQLENFVGSIHMWEAKTRIVIYDLGLTPAERDTVVNHWSFCTLRSTSFITALAPDFSLAELIKTYAFKAIVIKNALEEFESVVYIDAGLVLLRPLDAIRRRLARDGFALLPDFSKAFLWPHPTKHHVDTLRLTGCTGNKRKEGGAKLGEMCLAGIQGWTRNSWFERNILTKLFDCSVNKKCISPVGTNRTNHLQDQTALNGVLCSHELNICPWENNTDTYQNLFGMRRMVKPSDMFSDLYPAYLFRRYDKGAKDFCDTGLIWNEREER
jgi:hypothetical protein